MANKPRNTNGGHVYTFGGHNYPSVTTVLSKTQSKEDNTYLEKWRKTYKDPNFKNAEDYTEYTSIRGVLVHYNILNSVVGVVLDPSELPPISKWWHRREMLIKDIDKSKDLWRDLDLKLKYPLFAETPVYHPEMRYAGTPDLVGKMDNELVLIDLKTSSGIRDHHLIQIGAYAQILNRNNPNKIKTGYLVYLHPKFKKAILCEVSGQDLKDQTEEFNERLSRFWKIPGVKREYGLL